MVAVHNHYLANDGLRVDIERSLDTRFEISTLTEPTAVAAIINSRVRAHLGSARGDVLNDVIHSGAIERLFTLYRTGLRGELRGLLRTAHAALTDACDAGAELITTRFIDAAYSAWSDE